MKAVSSFLVVSFLFQELALANPDLLKITLQGGAEVQTSKAWAGKLLPAIPESIATVEDAYKAPDSRKTIILIQDAHTNDSGQINVAKTLNLIFQKQPIKYVFLEAGQGNESLSFLRKYASLHKRQEVAKSFLMQGKLQGTEYLDLTSDHNFTLYGVEDMTLYVKSVGLYREAVKQRQKFEEYLEKIDVTIQTLKPKLYNPSLLLFDQKHQASQKEQISLIGYFEILVEEARKQNISLHNYPHLKTLKRLKELESRIDFKKANEEQQKAVASLSEDDQKELIQASRAPSKLSNDDPKTKEAFFALLEEKLQPTNPSFPELAKYFKYLRQSKTLKAQKVLEEQKSLEQELFKSLVLTKDEEQLLKASKDLEILKKLLNLALTPDEFEDYQKTKQTITNLTGFLNQKIMDLNDHYDKAVFLEPGYEDIVKTCESFYELTTQRDRKFIENMLRKLSEQARPPKSAAGLDQNAVSVLISGGYHTPNLKYLLKQQNISYISLTPQVLQETNQKRYEEILLRQSIDLAKPMTFKPAISTNMPGRMLAAARLGEPAALKDWGSFVARLADTPSITDRILSESLGVKGASIPLNITATVPNGETVRSRVSNNATSGARLATKQSFQRLKQLDREYKIHPLLKPHLLSNEAGTQRLINALSSEPAVHDLRRHIGFSGFLNLDIMAARKSNYGILLDVDAREMLLWDLVRQSLVASPTPEEFVNELMTQITTKETQEPNFFFDGSNEELLKKVEVELKTASWLKSGDRFEHIRRMFLEDRIVYFRADILEPEIFQSIGIWIRENAGAADTVYASNIREWVTGRRFLGILPSLPDSQADANNEKMNQSISHVAGQGTYLIEAERTTDSPNQAVVSYIRMTESRPPGAILSGLFSEDFLLVLEKARLIVRERKKMLDRIAPREINSETVDAFKAEMGKWMGQVWQARGAADSPEKRIFGSPIFSRSENVTLLTSAKLLLDLGGFLHSGLLEEEFRRRANVLMDYWVLMGFLVWLAIQPLTQDDLSAEEINARLDVVEQVLAELQGEGGSGQQFVENVEELLSIGLSSYIDEGLYAAVLKNIDRSFFGERLFRYSKVSARMILRHLAQQFRGKNRMNIRAVNILDYVELERNLTTILLRYKNLLNSDPGASEKAKLAAILSQAALADPEAFVSGDVSVLRNLRVSHLPSKPYLLTLWSDKTKTISTWFKAYEDLMRDSHLLESLRKDFETLNPGNILFHPDQLDYLFTWAFFPRIAVVSMIHPGFEQYGLKDTFRPVRRDDSDADRHARWVGLLVLTPVPGLNQQVELHKIAHAARLATQQAILGAGAFSRAEDLIEPFAEDLLMSKDGLISIEEIADFYGFSVEEAERTIQVMGGLNQIRDKRRKASRIIPMIYPQWQVDRLRKAVRAMESLSGNSILRGVVPRRDLGTELGYSGKTVALKDIFGERLDVKVFLDEFNYNRRISAAARPVSGAARPLIKIVHENLLSSLPPVIQALDRVGLGQRTTLRQIASELHLSPDLVRHRLKAIRNRIGYEFLDHNRQISGLSPLSAFIDFLISSQKDDEWVNNDARLDELRNEARFYEFVEAREGLVSWEEIAEHFNVKVADVTRVLNRNGSLEKTRLERKERGGVVPIIFDKPVVDRLRNIVRVLERGGKNSVIPGVASFQEIAHAKEIGYTAYHVTIERVFMGVSPSRFSEDLNHNRKVLNKRGGSPTRLYVKMLDSKTIAGFRPLTRALQRKTLSRQALGKRLKISEQTVRRRLREIERILGKDFLAHNYEVLKYPPIRWPQNIGARLAATFTRTRPKLKIFVSEGKRVRTIKIRDKFDTRTHFEGWISIPRESVQETANRLADHINKHRTDLQWSNGHLDGAFLVRMGYSAARTTDLETIKGGWESAVNRALWLQTTSNLKYNAVHVIVVSRKWIVKMRWSQLLSIGAQAGQDQQRSLASAIDFYRDALSKISKKMKFDHQTNFHIETSWSAEDHHFIRIVGTPTRGARLANVSPLTTLVDVSQKYRRRVQLAPGAELELFVAPLQGLDGAKEELLDRLFRSRLKGGTYVIIGAENAPIFVAKIHSVDLNKKDWQRIEDQRIKGLFQAYLEGMRQGRFDDMLKRLEGPEASLDLGMDPYTIRFIEYHLIRRTSLRDEELFKQFIDHFYQEPIVYAPVDEYGPEQISSYEFVPTDRTDEYQVKIHYAIQSAARLAAEDFSDIQREVLANARQFGDIEIPENAKIVLMIGEKMQGSTAYKVWNEVFRKLAEQGRLIQPHAAIPFPIENRDNEKYKKVQRAIKQGLTISGHAELVGADVGAPYKSVGLEAIDQLDPEARAGGAVSTLTSGDGKLFGVGWDGEAWAAWFEKAFGNTAIPGKKAVLLGAEGKGMYVETNAIQIAEILGWQGRTDLLEVLRREVRVSFEQHAPAPRASSYYLRGDDVNSSILPARLNILIGNQKTRIQTYLEKGISEYVAAERRKGKKLRESIVEVTVTSVMEWLGNPSIDKYTKLGLLRAIAEGRFDHITAAHGDVVVFGTAGPRQFAVFNMKEATELLEKGFRAEILKGPNTINNITFLKLAEGTARYYKKAAEKEGREPVMTLAYDSRIQNPAFADAVAAVFLKNGFKVYLFDQASPTPVLSFGAAYVKSHVGILLSASHNDYRYGGFKVFGGDGAQLNLDERKKVIQHTYGTGTQGLSGYIPPVELSDIKDVLMASAQIEGVTEKGEANPYHPETLKRNVYRGPLVRQFSDATPRQVTILGEVNNPGDTKTPAQVDTASVYVKHVLSQLTDVALIRRQAANIKLLYMAFYGVGERVFMRVLKELGFREENIRIAQEVARQDGRFPIFSGVKDEEGNPMIPDPGNSKGNAKAVGIALQRHIRDTEDDAVKALGGVDLVAGTDPDADRFGANVPVAREYVPAEQSQRDAFLISYAAKDQTEAGQLGFQALRLLSANDTWALITKYRIDRFAEMIGDGRIPKDTRFVIIKSHVTTDALKALVNYSKAKGVRVEIQDTYVGFSLLAEMGKRNWEEGKVVLSMNEESGGFSYMGAPPPLYLIMSQFQNIEGLSLGVENGQVVSNKEISGLLTTDPAKYFHYSVGAIQNTLEFLRDRGVLIKTPEGRFSLSKTYSKGHDQSHDSFWVPLRSLAVETPGSRAGDPIFGYIPHQMGNLGHTLDKDGPMASFLLLEALAYAKEHGMTLHEYLLKDMYLDGQVGLFPDTNQPKAFENSPSGTAEKYEWLKAVLEMARDFAKGKEIYIEVGEGGQKVKKLVTGLRVLIPADQKNIKPEFQENFPVDNYYDALRQLLNEEKWRNNSSGLKNFFPEEGVRFYFGPDGVDGYDYITVRPSGTEPKIRFYVQLHPTEVTDRPLDETNLPQAMFKGADDSLALANGMKNAVQKRLAATAARMAESETSAARLEATGTVPKERGQSLKLQSPKPGVGSAEEALRNFILALLAEWRPSGVNGRKLALGNLNTLAPDILTFHAKEEKGLIVDLEGRNTPIVFEDIHQALNAYHSSRSQNFESTDELTAQRAKEVFSSPLVLEHDTLDQELETDLLIKIPVDGLRHLETPDDFRAAFAGLLAQLVLFRNATHSRDRISYSLKGTNLLPDWQKLLLEGMVKNLTFILKTEETYPKNALLADLTQAGTNETIHRERNAFTPPSAGIDYAQSHEQLQWTQVLVESYDLAAFLGKNLTGKSIDKAKVDQSGGIPRRILERHSRYTAKKTSVSSTDYLEVLFDSSSTSDTLFINLAFHLPRLGPLAFWSKISDKLLRSVSVAA